MFERFVKHLQPWTAIDTYIESEIQKQHIPGLSFALVRKGVLLRSRGYGISNVELSVPVHSETVFQIGSLTKQFTAAAILLLMEEGKVDLDAGPETYLSSLPEVWRGITLRHLLTHTSGLTDVTELPDFSYRVEYTKENFIQLVEPHPLCFPPGEGWSYSNTGYALLGWIIEDMSGQSFEEFLTKRIFAPLNMTDTRAIYPEQIVPRRAFGYTYEKSLCNGDPSRPRVIAGAGGLLSTALDLAKWDAALFTEEPLSSALKEIIWSPARLNDGKLAETTESCGKYYGFGWFLGEHRGRPLVSHTGQTDAGFTSEIIRFEEEQLTIILLGNVEPMYQDRIVKRVADLYLESLSS